LPLKARIWLELLGPQYAFVLQLSLFLHFTMEFSTQAKHTLEILDHISIYFLIAGYLLLLYAKSFGITLLSVLWGLSIRNNLYDFFFRKVEGFTLIYRNVLWLLAGGHLRVFLNILTMILIGASLYLIGVIFIYGRNIGTTTLSGIFCTRSCFSLRRYFIGGRV
jgi:channel protein (hemolysin III family)